MGHSLGGATAIQAVLHHPGRSLLSFSSPRRQRPDSTSWPTTTHSSASATPRARTSALLARAAFVRPLPPHVESLLDVIAQATPQHIEGAATSMRGFDRRSDLARIRVPTLLVCGDRDRHVPLRNHLATQQAIPTCGLQVYFDVGHVPFIETPDRFAADVTHFLDTAPVAQR
jgi:pimeloyl-ACP methyl ester carboxylesterase